MHEALSWAFKLKQHTITSIAVFLVVQARSTSDVTLLVISKFDYEELVHNYPEQNDIIVTNVLSLFGLDKDGNDTSVSKDTPDTTSDDAKEKLRQVLHGSLSASAEILPKYNNMIQQTLHESLSQKHHRLGVLTTAAAS